MDIELLRQHSMAKKGVTEEFPFDSDTLVFKVMGKMFALAPLERWEGGEKTITLKCDPEYAQELRAEYESVTPGYHMNNRHWNTIDISSGELALSLITALIDHSYDLVVAKLPRHKKPE